MTKPTAVRQSCDIGRREWIKLLRYLSDDVTANFAAMQAPAFPLKRLALPFKIGIIQNGEWQAPADLESHPFFQGYVVFLQNGRAVTAAHDVDMKGRSVAFEGEK